MQLVEIIQILTDVFIFVTAVAAGHLQGNWYI